MEIYYYINRIHSDTKLKFMSNILSLPSSLENKEHKSIWGYFWCVFFEILSERKPSRKGSWKVLDPELVPLL